MKKNLISIVLSMVLAAILLAGCTIGTKTGSSAPKASSEAKSLAAKEYTVEIKDFDFNPKAMTVEAGSKVTFTNQDDVKHTVTAKDNSFDSGLLAKGQKWEKTFDKPGTYYIHCTPHPDMLLTIIVK